MNKPQWISSWSESLEGAYTSLLLIDDGRSIVIAMPAQPQATASEEEQIFRDLLRDAADKPWTATTSGRPN